MPIVSNQKNVLFIGGWYYMMGRGPHWARCFYEDGYRVTVLGDVSLHTLAANHFNPIKLQAIAQTTLADVHHAYAVPIVPFPRFRISRQLSAFIFEKLYLPWFMQARTNDETIVWVYRPTQTFDFRRYPRKTIVLDIPDDSAGLIRDEKTKKEIWKIEERQAREADFVLTSAATLFQRCREWNPNTFLVRNAVDYDFFSCDIDPATISAEMYDMIEPCKTSCIVGYQGAISAWFDFDLVEYLIKRFPEYAFVFLGPVSPQVSGQFQHKICRYQNAYYWGMQPYERLPFFLKQFALGMIPFIVEDLTRAVNPLKLYEYLASETPVVSVALPEVEQYTEQGVVGIGASYAQFGDCLESMMATRDEAHVRRRCREIALANSWRARYDEVRTILNI